MGPEKAEDEQCDRVGKEHERSQEVLPVLAFSSLEDEEASRRAAPKRWQCPFDGPNAVVHEQTRHDQRERWREGETHANEQKQERRHDRRGAGR